MKSKTVILLGGTIVLTFLSTPIRPTAQEEREQAERATKPETGTTNPVPLINQPLVPDAVAPGGAAFTLTVNGTGFVSGSVVNWNGSSRTTTFVSSSQLTAGILASDIATASTASMTVVNPSPGAAVRPTLSSYQSALPRLQWRSAGQTTPLSRSPIQSPPPTSTVTGSSTW